MGIIASLASKFSARNPFKSLKREICRDNGRGHVEVKGVCALLGRVRRPDPGISWLKICLVLVSIMHEEP